MQMLVTIGPSTQPPAWHPKVEFDSSNPDASRDSLGPNWGKWIRENPSLLKADYEKELGDNIVKVLTVSGPVFDIGPEYHRERYDLETVSILSCQKNKDKVWLYTFRLSSGEVYTLSEVNLLRFLTETVQIKELPSV